MLFENEQFNVTRIHNVVHYAPTGHTVYRFPGRLPTYELMYYDQGDVTVRFGQQELHVKAGDMLYLPKGLENSQYAITVHEPFSLYNVYFDTDCALPDQAVPITADNERMLDQYRKAFRVWVGKGTGYYYQAMQLTYQIIEQLRRLQQRYVSGDKQRYLAAAETYMQEHYCDLDFDYTAMVQCSGISYSYFKKLFIGKYGCPPVRYVTRLKILRACELLQTASFSVSEVAHLCGFENVYYFSTVFKKQIGLSPKSYQKAVLEGKV